MWIPSEDEWYKAAYYDPTPGAGGGDNYWLYPMQTDTLVNNSVSANYYDGDFVGSGTAVFPTGNALTDVGAYAGQESFYGTLDQGGNVREWNDAVLALSRGARGGSWNGEGNGLRVFFRGSDGPSNEDYGLGFRVACVPEPGVSLLCTLAGGLVLRRRRR